MSYKLVTYNASHSTIDCDDLRESHHTLVCGKYVLIRSGDVFFWLTLYPMLDVSDGPFDTMKAAVYAAKVNTGNEVLCFSSPKEAFEHMLENNMLSVQHLRV